jgi:hypothetical protein
MMCYCRTCCRTAVGDPAAPRSQHDTFKISYISHDVFLLHLLPHCSGRTCCTWTPSRRAASRWHPPRSQRPHPSSCLLCPGCRAALCSQQMAAPRRKERERMGRQVRTQPCIAADAGRRVFGVLRQMADTAHSLGIWKRERIGRQVRVESCSAVEPGRINASGYGRVFGALCQWR